MTNTSIDVKDETSPKNLTKTHYIFVQDHSGSMRGEPGTLAMNDFNENLQTIRKVTENHSDVSISLIEFCHDAVIKQWQEPLSEASEIDEYPVNGSTALFGAIDTAITKAQENLDDDTAVCLLIFTDGQENSTPAAQMEACKSKLKDLSNDNRWTITFLGCNYTAEEAADLATTFHIPAGNIAVSKNVSEGAFNVRSMAVSSYATTRNSGDTVHDTFYSEDGSTTEITD